MGHLTRNPEQPPPPQPGHDNAAEWGKWFPEGCHQAAQVGGESYLCCQLRRHPSPAAFSASAGWGKGAVRRNKAACEILLPPRWESSCWIPEEQEQALHISKVYHKGPYRKSPREREKPHLQQWCCHHGGLRMQKRQDVYSSSIACYSNWIWVDKGISLYG